VSKSFGAWNGEFHWPVKNDQFYPDIVMVCSCCGCCRYFGDGGSLVCGSLYSCGVHLSDWWIPYLRGTGLERRGFYRFYSSRTQILPVIGSHHPPDGGHAVLDFFVLLALILSCSAAFVNSREGKTP
jgi:hypothetical protein